MRRPMRTTSCALAVAAMAVVAGCGGSGGSSTGASTTGPASAASDPANTPNVPLSCDTTLTSGEILKYPVPKADEEYTVTLMTVSLAGYYYQAVAYGAQKAADEAGVKLEVVAGQGFSSAAQQVTQAANALTRGTDAILLQPADINGSVPVVEQAAAKGVPVVDIGSLVDSDDAIKVQQDDYEQGKAAAEALVKQLPDGGAGVVMGGPANATWATRRVAGFQDALKDHPEVKVSAVVNSLVDPGEGLAKFTNAATSQPDVDWIYAVYNLLLPPDSIPAEYQDAVYVAGAYDPVTQKALESGRAQAVIADWPVYMGYVGMAQAIEKLNGGSPASLTCFDSPVITKENMDSRVADAQFYPSEYKAGN